MLDSMDLEREKGITILAKNTAVHYGDLTINIVDTPGHADFGGEVERGLTMVDGVLLLVDASEGPLPQTRFVLRKTLEARLPVICVINKIDRPDARAAEVIDAVYELFIDLGRRRAPDRVPDRVLQRPRRPGRPGRRRRGRQPGPQGAVRPAGRAHPGARRTRRVTRSRRWSPTSTPRPTSAGWPCAGSATAGSRRATRWPGAATTAPSSGCACPRCTSPRRWSASTPRPRGPGPGDIIAVAGMPEIMIGDTLADPDDPRPLPVIPIDEPSHQHDPGRQHLAAGRHGRGGRPGGTKLTARLIKSRLDAELVGNVSVRVLPTERPDTWEVQGRGELALAVLVELMRREGFELTVGKPQVLTREINGKLHEPMERVSVDVPEDFMGVVTQLLSLRKGRMETMTNHGHTGWCRMEWLVPSRGLIGFRTEFLTETRGTGQLHHVFEGYEPWHGELRTRPNGVMVADRRGPTTAYALTNLQERGAMFVGPGIEVYEGMIVGENARAEDMDVNPTKEKKLTNMRAAAADETVRLVPRLAAVPRAGAGVHSRGRVRRGDPGHGPAAQGDPRRGRAGPPAGRGPGASSLSAR